MVKRPAKLDQHGTRVPKAATTGVPRWVKVFGLIALALVLLLVITQLLAGGKHGPSRHTGSAPVGDAAPVVAVAAGHAPPEGSR